jgi:hypothetical protein
MKISKQTLDILKNFSQINSNILIREGNLLSTISVGKNIFARATVAEEFPKELAIYDLNSLLGLLTLSDDQEVEFGDNSLTVSKDGGTFEYFYADSSIIVAPPNKEIKLDPHFEFSLSAADVGMLVKAASITGATTLSVIADGTEATLVIGDPKTSSSNSYRKSLGDTELEFDCRLGIDNFKVLNDSYDISLSKKKFMHLKSSTKEVLYFLALEPESVI